MANSFELRPLTVDNFEQSLEFLREHFFPFEPCAVNIDLCPYGYKIPALEDSIVEILAKGYSIGAFDGTKLYGILILDEKVSLYIPKLFWLTVRKNCSSDREKPLKFSAFSL